MATPPSKGKLLYHITHINNMPSILKYGLMPRAEMQRRGLSFTDIADPQIISKRGTYNSNLPECVLFHFYAKNPFDGDVCKRYGSENMVIITITRPNEPSDDFCVIPVHPLDREEPKVLSYQDGIKQVKWDILDGTGNQRDYHVQEIKNACMAECLVKQIVMPNEFCYIYVSNQEAKSRILRMENGNRLNVSVNPHMFP